MSLKIKFYDVEHGSCTHIKTPSKKHFLFDIGTKANKSIITISLVALSLAMIVAALLPFNWILCGYLLLPR